MVNHIEFDNIINNRINNYILKTNKTNIMEHSIKIDMLNTLTNLLSTLEIGYPEDNELRELTKKQIKEILETKSH